jgi:hypothetical protein
MLAYLQPMLAAACFCNHLHMLRQALHYVGSLLPLVLAQQHWVVCLCCSTLAAALLCLKSGPCWGARPPSDTHSAPFLTFALTHPTHHTHKPFRRATQ